MEGQCKHQYKDIGITIKERSRRRVSVNEWKKCEVCGGLQKICHGKYPADLILKQGVVIKDDAFTKKVILQMMGGNQSGMPMTAL